MNKVVDEVDAFYGGGYLRQRLEGAPGLTSKALDWIMDAVALRLQRCQPRRRRASIVKGE